MPPAPPCAAGGGVVYMGCSTPPPPPLVKWVVGFRFSVSHPSPLWCGSGWWLLGLRFAPPRPLWCGWWGFRCIDMSGFRVECQQLGTARTETVARPGECRRIGHATKLHSLKRHNTQFPALPLGGGGGYHGGGGWGGGVPTRDTRPYISILVCYNIRLLVYWHISTLIIIHTLI